jgi:DNA primase
MLDDGIAGNIVAALGIKVSKKNSRGWMCHCPYHKDNTPSLSIHPQKLLYNCFSCNRSGPLFKLYEDILGVPYEEKEGDAFARFAQPIIYTPPTDDELRAPVPPVSIDVRGVFTPITDAPAARSFLRRRGLTTSLVAKFGATSYMEEGTINGTYFKKKIIVPVVERGEIISLEGRSIDKRIKPKVMYPKDTVTATLMNFDNLNKDEPLYLAEGSMDFFVLQTDEFFRNSTSIFGAQIGERQLAFLKEFRKIVIVPDKDPSGNRSVQKIIKKLKRQVEIYILPIPDVPGMKDIGDFPEKLQIWPAQLRRQGWLNKMYKAS